MKINNKGDYALLAIDSKISAYKHVLRELKETKGEDMGLEVAYTIVKTELILKELESIKEEIEGYDEA